jgi:hypothetical protein
MTDNEDEVRNEDQHPLWDGPDISAPTSSTVFPGFTIGARTGIMNPDEWELQIYSGSNMLKSVKGDGGREFSYWVPASLISPGLFWFRIDYYKFPVWSRWTLSGDKTMLPAPIKLEIISPVDGEIVTVAKPIVSGYGTPGWSVLLYSQIGGAYYGGATVGSNGVWEAKLSKSLFPGKCTLIARESLNTQMSDYSKSIEFLFDDRK